MNSLSQYRWFMNMVKAIVADDELPTAKRLTAMIGRLRPQWDVEMLPGNISVLKKWFSENPQPDIMFLDIRLEDGIVFDLLQEVYPTGLVIFTTAYSEYALDAFKVNGIDYLLKPIGLEALTRAVTRCRTRVAGSDIEAVLKALSGRSGNQAPRYKRRWIKKTEK